MSINEFVSFVALVCNMTAPSTQVSHDRKQDCFDYYNNCAVKDDGKIDRLVVSNCNMNAQKASWKWSK